MKLCSFDARSKGQPRPLPYREVARVGSAALNAPVMAHSTHHRSTYTNNLGRIILGHSLRPCLGKGASLGEEAGLVDSERAGEIVARGGRVRSLAFLSILRLW
jgi:hypothetical protein